MSIKGIIITAAIVGAVGYFLAYVPGSPFWGLVHRPETVALGASGDTQAGVDGGGTAPGEAPAPTREVKIITVLSKDAIPAILDPTFVSGEAAAAQMRDRELVIGLSINGDHRAYSTSLLSSHEVVNDTVGGVPIVVTW